MKTAEPSSCYAVDVLMSNGIAFSRVFLVDSTIDALEAACTKFLGLDDPETEQQVALDVTTGVLQLSLITVQRGQWAASSDLGPFIAVSVDELRIVGATRQRLDEAIAAAPRQTRERISRGNPRAGTFAIDWAGVGSAALLLEGPCLSPGEVMAVTGPEDLCLPEFFSIGAVGDDGPLDDDFPQGD
jgi:hypothetical protein